MRAFLTGSSGFVGTWLSRHLLAQGDEVLTLPEEIDVSDAGAVSGCVHDAGADVIYHLAALAQVAASWDAPDATFAVNAIGTLHVLEAARTCARPPRVLLVSSAEVYGGGGSTPITEDAPLLPVTPYAASKVAAEYLGLQAFLGRGLEVVRARPFNHVGPGQADAFVVSALARRVAEAERAGTTEIRVGNLAAARDFTDVRDVVRAYRLLCEDGVAGEVYNVCSGRPVPVATLFEELVALASTPINAVEDPALFRPVDVPVLSGDGSALHALTGWVPEIVREQTLRDVLWDWRERLSAPDGRSSGSV